MDGAIKVRQEGIIMITKEQIQTLDDRALKWYRKHITQFHQECLQFEKCYHGDQKQVFHEHFKELEKLLTQELERRDRYSRENKMS